MPNNTSAQDKKSTARSLLWMALVISAVCNATTSATGMNVIVSIGFGLLTLASGVALVAHYRRHR
ncbi:MAG TPA: hypothetical protein VJX66_17160 [Amycolatopsis sp.]|nr:hypothetical protein [Amycolatopsis sp.]